MDIITNLYGRSTSHCGRNYPPIYGRYDNRPLQNISGIPSEVSSEDKDLGHQPDAETGANSVHLPHLSVGAHDNKQT